MYNLLLCTLLLSTDIMVTFLKIFLLVFQCLVVVLSYPLSNMGWQVEKPSYSAVKGTVE